MNTNKDCYLIPSSYSTRFVYLRPLNGPVGQPSSRPTDEKINTQQLHNLPNVTQPGSRRTGFVLRYICSERPDQLSFQRMGMRNPRGSQDLRNVVESWKVAEAVPDVCSHSQPHFCPLLAFQNAAPSQISQENFNTQLHICFL